MVLDETKPVALTIEERAYLAGLLKPHSEYYRTLAGSSKSTDRNREMYNFTKALEAKLQRL